MHDRVEQAWEAFWARRDREDDLRELFPIVKLARSDPLFGRMYPFMSFNRLCFGPTTSGPDGLLPCLVVNKAGRFEVFDCTYPWWLDREESESLGETDLPDEALAIAKRHLPSASAVARIEARRFADPAKHLFCSAWEDMAHALMERWPWAYSDSQRAMLWAALSAEGRINAFLAGTLKPRDAEALDDLSFPEKYALGPRIAIGQDLFPRDRDPWVTLEALYRIRNELVHLRPVSAVVLDDADALDPLYVNFNPATAERIVLAVAQATCTLADAAPHLGADVKVERGLVAYKAGLPDDADKD